VARLENLTFLEKRPSLLYNLQIDQAAAHLGLGNLYRDQDLIHKALEQLTKAHDLTQEHIIIEDSPGQQDRLGVILTTHGEILNIPDQSTPEDIRNALDKQQRAVAIFRQLEQTTIGPLREQTLRNLLAALLAMADTLESLELYKESQEAMRESQVIGKRAQIENNTSSLHLHQQRAASTKEMMDARRELDDHTSTLHVGSKIRLHGLINQRMN
jgi:tetratricopeptide (TPR) repeat protein